MKSTDRLLARLRAAGLDLPEGARIVRCYPSASSRNTGAWSWTVADKDGIPLDRDTDDLRQRSIGSQWSVGELLKTGFTVSEPDRFGDVYIDQPDSERKEPS